MHEIDFEDSMAFLIGLKGPIEAVIRYNWDNGVFRQSLGWLLLQHKIFLDTWRCGLCEFAINHRKANKKEICQECLYYCNYQEKKEDD